MFSYSFNFYFTFSLLGSQKVHYGKRQNAPGLQLPDLNFIDLLKLQCDKKARFMCAQFLDLVSQMFQDSRIMVRLQYEMCTVDLINKECVFGVARIYFSDSTKCLII